MGRGRGWKRASTSSYQITFNYQGVKCRERIKLKPSPANDKRIARHREAILDSIGKGTFDYSVTFPESKNALKFLTVQGKAITIEHQLSEWLLSVRSSLKTSTFNDYKKIVNNQLIPEFGHLSLTELKISHVKIWAGSMDVTAKRINNIISPLRQAFAEAYEDELIERNPLYGWSYRGRNNKKSDFVVDPLSQDEQSKLLSVLKGQALNQIQFELWTGIRPSELVALNWGDIDLESGYIRIDKAITQASDDAEGTKTASGIRDIKILPPAREALIRQREHTFLKFEEVFQNPIRKERWKGDQPIRKTLWIPAIKKSGIRYRNPYQTRHTYASMMLTAGESALWVAQQMGHKDVTMIYKTYGKWIPSAVPDAGDKAAKLFGGQSGNRTEKGTLKGNLTK